MINKFLTLLKKHKKLVHCDMPISYNIPKELIKYIKDNIFFFSICETKNEMKALSGMLLTDKKEIKPFYKFHQEVQNIYPKCEWKKLEQEYNLAVACSLMAVKHNDELDDDRYCLQLREYEGREFTLASTDSFWKKYYPPNDWTDNRFFVSRIRKNKHPESDSVTAQEYMSKRVDVLFQYDFRNRTFPIDWFIDYHAKLKKAP